MARTRHKVWCHRDMRAQPRCRDLLVSAHFVKQRLSKKPNLRIVWIIDASTYHTDEAAGALLLFNGLLDS
jgi:hypothetical protein